MTDGSTRPAGRAEPVLRVEGITKRFPGVLANDHISLELHRGEVLGMLGENGAGKSTLMNIIYGLYTPDEGEIFINGARVEIHEPNDAIRHGIGMVHQHFMLVPILSVAENIMLGVEQTRNRLFLDEERVIADIEKLAAQHGLEVDPRAIVEDLPVGDQQRAEIIKALYRGAEILILDEPTAVLTPQEADDLFVIMRSLTAQGKSIIFITHKLREVMDVADRIAVLRGGQLVGVTTPAETTREELATMMVGREVLLRVEKKPATPGEVVMQVRDLRVRDERHHMAVDGVSFDVRAGEVLGVAGVQGNGQRELVEALTGLRAIEAGQIKILGIDTTNAPPRAITEIGSAHVPEDRHKHGVVLGYPVEDNLALVTYHKSPFTQGFMLNTKAIEAYARRLVEDFDIRTPSIETPVSSLSGGNQQKLIVAREFSRDVKLLIAAQPTRGIDVGSIEFIHNNIIAQRDAGVAVLLISAELDEIMALSDRIAVMYKGQIVGIVDAATATREQLGLLMCGAVEDAELLSAPAD
ncbi:MAG: ABC transporter ATP-binding protein [Anaerolineae bacterium]|nr:ABC transporter ATP-binding protein [Anaerolineae bacterium]